MVYFHFPAQHNWESIPVYSASPHFHAKELFSTFCVFFSIYSWIYLHLYCVRAASMLCSCDAFKALASPWLFQRQLLTLALSIISCYQLLSSFSKHNKRCQSVPQLAGIALAVAQGGVNYLFPKWPAGWSLTGVHQGQWQPERRI